MSRNGSGVYSLPAGNPVTTNTTISSSWANSTLSDIATALTQSLSKDGQTVPTGNLPMGGNKLTGLGAATGNGESLRFEQLFSQGNPIDVAGSGTTDIGSVSSNFLNITGSATITSFGTNYNGPKYLKFTGSTTLTYNATTLVTPAAANIVTLAGDTAIAVPKSTASGIPDGWEIVFYSEFYGSDVAFKNRIINGAMQIDQRNNGSTTTGEWCCDRWSTINSSGVLTKQRVQDSPQGFGYSQKVTVTSAGTRNSGDFAAITQKIEGCNIADLNFGSANAKTISFSFWVKSSLTGLFSGGFSSGNNNRFYGFTYTITTANVWQKIVVQGVLGDTTGGITEYPTSQGGVAGLIVKLDLGSGSTYQGTANSWNSQTNRLGLAGTVGFAQTSSAIFQVTEVQLERGLLATDFDFRDTQQELSRCQRYFELINGGVVTASILKEFYYKVTKAKLPTISNITISSGSGATFTNIFTSHVYQETVNSVNTLFSLWATAEL